MTPLPVQKYLQLDRAIADIMPFLGVDKRNYDLGDQQKLDDAIASLQDAFDFIQKYIEVQERVI